MRAIVGEIMASSRAKVFGPHFELLVAVIAEELGAQIGIQRLGPIPEPDPDTLRKTAELIADAVDDVFVLKLKPTGEHPAQEIRERRVPADQDRGPASATYLQAPVAADRPRRPVAAAGPWFLWMLAVRSLYGRFSANARRATMSASSGGTFLQMPAGRAFSETLLDTARGADICEKPERG